MGTVSSFDRLVSTAYLNKTGFYDGFVELFQEKYLFTKINENNV